MGAGVAAGGEVVAAEVARGVAGEILNPRVYPRLSRKPKRNTGSRKHDESISLQLKHSARGGGQLKYLYRFGDLDGMYTDLSFDRMSHSLRNNIARLRESTSKSADRKYPLRNLDRICVSRKKSDEGRNICMMGPAYNHGAPQERDAPDAARLAKH